MITALTRAIEWLRSGYPAEIPARGYVPLLALHGQPR
jgi:Protein of unknown function (DUF3349)